jgi:Tfp pilus assembly protein PilF
MDSGYALAYAGLADTYIMLTEMGPVAPTSAMPTAKEMAMKALELDPDLPEAHASMCMILQDYDYDFVGAEREARIAIQLNPNSSVARQAYGIVLTKLGRHAEAKTQFTRALEIDPLSVVCNWVYSFCLFLAGQPDDAIRQASRALELDPGFGVAHITLAFAYQMKGDYERSVEEYARSSEVTGFKENAQYIRESFKGGWEGFLRAMTTQEKNRPMTFSSYIIAVLFAALGDIDGALRELDASFLKRESHLTMLKVDPRFEAFHDDPRFNELLDRIGFPK